jgi:hypothetical protein
MSQPYEQLATPDLLLDSVCRLETASLWDSGDSVRIQVGVRDPEADFDPTVLDETHKYKNDEHISIPITGEGLEIVRLHHQSTGYNTFNERPSKHIDAVTRKLTIVGHLLTPDSDENAFTEVAEHIVDQGYSFNPEARVDATLLGSETYSHLGQTIESKLGSSRSNTGILSVRGLQHALWRANHREIQPTPTTV